MSLEVGASQVVSLLGRNGMGKTTTVRSIMGIARPKAGTITFDGKAMNGLPSYRIAQAGFGLVPEGRQVFPNLTVRENLVATALRSLDARARAESLSQPARAPGPLRQPALRRRAADARHRPRAHDQPRLSILDEATEGLAPLVRGEIYRSIERLKGDGLPSRHRQGRQVADPSRGPPLRARERARGVERQLAGCAADQNVQHRYLGVDFSHEARNVVGRANVEDTPELEEYYRALEGEELGALWNVANEIEPWFPQPKSVPIIWKWQRVEPFVRRAPDLVSAEKPRAARGDAGEPGRKEWSAAVGSLHRRSGDESRRVHVRASASGERATVRHGRPRRVHRRRRRAPELGARDFVLTPNGTWHDHGVSADGTQCIWQDGLDIPLMNSLDANFYEVHPKIVQTPAALSRDNWSKPYSPVFLYKWDDAYHSVKKTASTNIPIRSPAAR